jgi:iron(III) transport system substrate-binding protein
MKKTQIVTVVFCLVLLFGLFAATPKVKASSTAGWEAKWSNLVDAAKKEGKLMIYGRGDPEVRKELGRAFAAKYGIDLEFLYTPRGRELAAKLKRERGAGLYLADVIIHGTTTMLFLLKPTGIIEPLDPVLIPPELTNPKLWRGNRVFIDEEHMIKPIRATFNRFAIRNTDLVKEGEVTSFRDLLDPKWKGKMVMFDPTGPGSGSAVVGFLYSTWGREQTLEFLRQLVKQEPVITREIRAPLEWISRGKYAIGIGLREDAIPEFLDLKTPLAPLKMIEGGLLSAGAANVAIASKPPHPNAAILFVNWILTKEGQTVWSKAEGHPAGRVDVPTDWINPIFVAGPDEKVYIHDEAGYRRRGEIMKLCKEIFAPVLK